MSSGPRRVVFSAFIYTKPLRLTIRNTFCRNGLGRRQAPSVQGSGQIAEPPGPVTALSWAAVRKSLALCCRLCMWQENKAALCVLTNFIESFISFNLRFDSAYWILRKLWCKELFCNVNAYFPFYLFLKSQCLHILLIHASQCILRFWEAWFWAWVFEVSFRHALADLGVYEFKMFFCTKILNVSLILIVFMIV